MEELLSANLSKCVQMVAENSTFDGFNGSPVMASSGSDQPISTHGSKGRKQAGIRQTASLGKCLQAGYKRVRFRAI